MSSKGTTAIPLPSGSMALSLQLGDPQRVAGFLGTGSEVAIFATVPTPAGTAGGGGGTQTTLLIKKVPGDHGRQRPAACPTAPRAASTTDDSIPRAIVTLGVTQAQAQKLIFAQSRGQLYLTLVNDATEPAEPAAHEPEQPVGLRPVPLIVDHDSGAAETLKGALGGEATVLTSVDALRRHLETDLTEDCVVLGPGSTR